MKKDLIYKSFGLKLRNARKKKGLTQVDLSKRVGLSRTSITNIEKGRQGISLHLLIELAAAVGSKPVTLLPEPNNAVEQDLIDKRIFKTTTIEKEGVNWAQRIISSGRKKEVDNESD